MAFNERWQGVLNRPPPPPEGSLREGLQVHVNDLFAHGDGRRMGRMPLAPDAVGTDVEEFHARSAVITLSQRGDEGAVFGKVDRVGVIRFDARDSPAAAGRIAAAGIIFKPLGTAWRSGAWTLTTSCLAITPTWAALLAQEDSARALVTTWSPRPPRTGTLIICWEWLNPLRSGTRGPIRSWSITGPNCWKRHCVFVCRFAGLGPRIITKAGRAICSSRRGGPLSNGFG